MTPEQRAKRLIGENDYMTIATSSAASVPWVSPVFYVVDADDIFYWVSDRSAQHSGNIRNNPAVAIVIWQTDPVDAVYITARAGELDDITDIEHAMRALQRKPQPEQWTVRATTDILDDSPWRIYRAIPTCIELRALKVKNGKAVVTREPVDMRQTST